MTIHDTWNVVGLAGTGSHDIEVNDAFVPAARSVSFFTDRLQRPGPLYAFPVFGLLALGVSAVALGIAQSASDAFRRLAAEKTPFGGKRTLAARPAVQTQIAEIEAQIRAARAFLHSAIDRAYQATLEGGDVPIERRAEMRLAACHATTSAARAVDLAFAAAGGLDLRVEPAPAVLPRRPRRHPARDGRPGDPGARRQGPGGPRGRHIHVVRLERQSSLMTKRALPGQSPSHLHCDTAAGTSHDLNEVARG